MPLQDPSDPNAKFARDIGYAKSPELSPEDAQLLKDIAMLESSGGIDTDHQLVTNPASVQYGHKAIGRYGLMPNTLHEFMRRAERTGNIPYSARHVRGASPEELAQEAKTNPEFEEVMSRQLLAHLRKKQADDAQAALMWKQGHNLTTKEAQAMVDAQLKDPKSRASKFANLRSKLASR